MKNVLAERRLTQRGGGDGTHRPHMYPTPGQAWGMGVVRGCTRAVPVRPPSPFTPLLHNVTQSLHLKYTCSKRAVSNSSSLYTLFYSVMFNSVVPGFTSSVSGSSCNSLFVGPIMPSFYSSFCSGNAN